MSPAIVNVRTNVRDHFKEHEPYKRISDEGHIQVVLKTDMTFHDSFCIYSTLYNFNLGKHKLLVPLSKLHKSKKSESKEKLNMVLLSSGAGEK